MTNLNEVEPLVAKRYPGASVLIDTWRQFRPHQIFQEIARRVRFIEEMAEFDPNNISGPFIENLSNYNDGILFFRGRNRLRGFAQIDAPSVGQSLKYVTVDRGGEYSVGAEHNIYAIALDNHGFYGKLRELGPVSLGDITSIGDNSNLRSRVFEHIENEKGGRKSLLSWAPQVNPYIKG